MPTSPSDATFEQLGVPKLISTALQKAFPAIEKPTPSQRELIPAILSGKDVFLKDRTGSGKSFGLLLALLSLRRPVSKGPSHIPITSLVVVPHRDLAFQFLHWAERIHQQLPRREDLPSLAQVVVRDSSIPRSHQISELYRHAPHLLIGTAQALWDIHQEDEAALRLGALSAVVVDEVDSLIETPPLMGDKYKIMKVVRRIRAHPGPTRQLLDAIYHRGEDDEVPRLLSKGPKWKPMGKTPSGVQTPKLVMSSATFRAHSTFLATAHTWLKGRERRALQITGSQDMSKDSSEHQAHDVVGGLLVQHSVLVVSPDGTVCNIEGAAEPLASSTAAGDTNPQGQDDISLLTGLSFDTPPSSHGMEPGEALEDVPLPYRLNMLEAVAAAFAIDVPRVALLVLPASAPLKRVVDELRLFGVDAHGLDVVRKETGGAYLARGDVGGTAENPTLLVCTAASTRGLDLPDLSHVFLLGEPLPDEAPIAQYADTYLHAAGRVGRFGRSGKVVTVVEARSKGGKGRWVDQPERIRLVLKRVGVRPTKFAKLEEMME